MSGRRRTFAEAAAAYCMAREVVAALSRMIAAHGECQHQYQDADTVVESCYRQLADSGAEGGWSFWRASDSQLAEFCGPCRAQIPARVARHAARRQVGGFARAMREAYRRERPDGSSPAATAAVLVARRVARRHAWGAW